jgi:hypothetical protein
MEVTWSIAQLERNTEDGGVTVAHWRADATETVEDKLYSASSYGTCSFTPDAEAEGFVPFESLTESAVLEWCFATLDKEAAETALAAQIEEQKAPKTATGMPW